MWVTSADRRAGGRAEKFNSNGSPLQGKGGGRISRQYCGMSTFWYDAKAALISSVPRIFGFNFRIIWNGACLDNTDCTCVRMAHMSRCIESESTIFAEDDEQPRESI